MQRRRKFGFDRTQCDCELCRVPCRHIPGFLTIGDLEHLCPPDREMLVWAEEHLRAITEQPFPNLIPAQKANGHCHWLSRGRCAVHAHSPYGCAFFDAHLTKAEIEPRLAAAIKAMKADAARKGLYYRVWMHLQAKGLVVASGDYAAMLREQKQIRRRSATDRQTGSGRKATSKSRRGR